MPSAAPSPATKFRRDLGHGVGLRLPHFDHLLENPAGVDWFEIISENFMMPGGRPLAVLERVRSQVPVVMHGVSLSIGSHDPLNRDYLRELKALMTRIEPANVSDHLCWGSAGGAYFHDLLPLPYSEEALAHVAQRVGEVQDFLGRRILIENVSSYIEFQASTLTEWEFLAALAERADCGILLDLNNIFVSASNHGYDPRVYLDSIPAERIGQFHLAGHSIYPEYRLDTHDAPICDEVWELYADATRRCGAVPCLIEWDDKIPEFPELAAAAKQAAGIEKKVLLESGTPSHPAPVRAINENRKLKPESPS